MDAGTDPGRGRRCECCIVVQAWEWAKGAGLRAAWEGSRAQARIAVMR